MTDEEIKLKRTPFWRKKWPARLLMLLLMVGLYRMLIWVLPWFVDVKKMRNGLADWTSLKLRNTAAVSVNHIDLGLNFAGTAKLTIHDLQIDPPNEMDFEQPFLSVERIKMRCPAWGLWGGPPTTPVVRLKNPRARLTWSEFGDFNLMGLCDPIDKVKNRNADFPIFDMTPSRVFFRLEDGRLILNHKQKKQKFEIGVNGELEYDSVRHRLDGSLTPSRFSYQAGDGKETEAEIHIQHFSLEPSPPEERFPFMLALGTAEVENFPLYLTRFFFPQMPKIRTGVNASGKIELTDYAVNMDLDLAGIDLSAFGLGENAGFKGNYRFPLKPRRRRTRRPYAELNLSLFNPGENSLARAQIFLENGICTLGRINCRQLKAEGISELFLSLGKGWQKRISSSFRELSIKAESLQIIGLDIAGSTCKVTTRDKALNLEVEGALGGGAFAMKMPNFDPRAGTVGDGFSAAVIGARIEKLGKGLRSRVPQLVWMEDATGSIDIELHRLPITDKENASQPHWLLKASAKDIEVKLGGAGTIFRELASIPVNITRVEVLRRKALSLALPKQIHPADPISTLKFDTLNFSYEVFPDGSSRVKSIFGRSPQLGLLVGGGRSLPDKSVKIAVSLAKTPAAIFSGNKALSDSVRQAIHKQVNHDTGLRLDITTTGNETKVEQRYVQDIFRLWTELEAAKTEAPKTPAADPKKSGTPDKTSPAPNEKTPAPKPKEEKK